MSIEKLSGVRVGDTELRYRHNPQTGRVELSLVPDGAAYPPIDRSARPDDTLIPLAEVKLRGDHNPCGFGAGRTMRDSGSTEAFRFREQKIAEREIVTVLADPRGYELIHRLSWRNETPVFTIRIEFRNNSASPAILDMIESFALGGLGPYAADEQFERIKLHRFRSNWSAEGYHVSDSAEALHLERSWSGHSINCERFGQVGTMPVRGFHPFAAVEDTVAGVCWGAQLAWAGSWQMEFSRRRNFDFSLSGGLADREFGHWSKSVAPGESFAAPEAFLGCSAAGFDALCGRLLAEQEARLDLPESEEDLPIIFNEWCTTWGDPREEKVLTLADKLKGTPVRYFVIDAGWFKTPGTEWYTAQGDWDPNPEMFPDGLRATADRLRERGFIPGIWFEFEVCGSGSRAFREQVAHHLTLDGIPVFPDRHFWNLNDPEAVAYLEEKVVRMLKENHFGYVKVDYNETVGFGCDHPDSPGEGLRRQVLGTYRMFRRMREVNPELVIENCSSGGHRLEPSMFALSSMSSFSDAHEEPEIPVIAASLHRLMLPRQCQIWAVVKPEHDLKKLGYILSSAMLGRFCLSGDILKLDTEQWKLTCDAMEFYRRLVPVLKHGRSTLATMMSPAWRRLRGNQILVRQSGDGQELALFVHVFDNPPSQIGFRLPPGDWKIVDEFATPQTGVSSVVSGEFRLDAPSAMSGRVIRLRK
ncbi:MAG: alpha-galactosidase [Lentisphaeria bacterium]|nr:alpha-galactosidase [Lentisphaeria bacterium]